MDQMQKSTFTEGMKYCFLKKWEWKIDKKEEGNVWLQWVTFNFQLSPVATAKRLSHYFYLVTNLNVFIQQLIQMKDEWQYSNGQGAS